MASIRRSVRNNRNTQAAIVADQNFSLEIVKVILVDGNFRAEIRNFPIFVATETAAVVLIIDRVKAVAVGKYGAAFVVSGEIDVSANVDGNLAIR